MFPQKTIGLFICMIFLLSSRFSFSEIYQYKDENGVWHYTDSPDTFEGKKAMAGAVSTSDIKNIEDYLYGKYTPKTQLERATIATVMIKGTMGTGSGFFITSKGHIITNKHVLRGDEDQLERADQYIEHVDESFKEAEEEVKYHEAQLEQIQENLAAYRRYIDSLSNKKEKEMEAQRYQLEMKRYQEYKENVAKRSAYVGKEKKKFKSEKVDYTVKKSIGGLQKHFDVILKDGTELYAYVISVSRDHDLALLKIDGYVTPRLKPNKNHIRQGTIVYAIGNPGGIRDNVTSGIVSGHDGQYIRTNAEIYPGNSGGPLITKEGEIIGINTLKKTTYKYEGIGYAIPIATALSEFNQYINP